MAIGDNSLILNNVNPVIDVYCNLFNVGKNVFNCLSWRSEIKDGNRYYVLTYCCNKFIKVYDYYRNNELIDGYYIVVDGIFVGYAQDTSYFDIVMDKCIKVLDNLKEDNENAIKFIKIS